MVGVTNNVPVFKRVPEMAALYHLIVLPAPGKLVVNAVNPDPQTDNTPLTVGAVGVGFTVKFITLSVTQPVVGLLTFKFTFFTPALGTV